MPNFALLFRSGESAMSSQQHPRTQEGFLHAEQVKTFATLLDEVVLAVVGVAI